MDVSQRIKAIRTEKGIKQADIARELGIERTSYHRLENRGEKLTIEQASAIAKTLGVTLIDLISEPDQPGGPQRDRESSDLKARVKELEDWLQDKQFRIDTYKRGINEIWITVTRILFDTALELNLVNIPQLPTDEKTEQIIEEFYSAHHKVWGDTLVNERQEPILAYGTQSLTVDNLFQIFDHLDKTEEHFIDLLNNIFLETNMFADGLAKIAFQNWLLKQLQKPQVKNRAE